MNTARAYEREVGKHRTLEGYAFHVAKQVVVGGIVLDHNRHFVGFLVNQHIDQIAPGHFFIQRRIGDGRLLFIVFQKNFQALGQILTHFLEVRNHLRHIPVFLDQLVDLVAGDAFQCFLVERLLAFGVFLLPIRQFA